LANFVEKTSGLKITQFMGGDIFKKRFKTFQTFSALLEGLV
jgi:hypothetical protein